jgi:hypothetical protein
MFKFFRSPTPHTKSMNTALAATCIAIFLRVRRSL